ncbi:hypothetical protein VNO78_06340 [Psophocarpus tetragonolobus]|uniref:Receptor-like serine/threonine-protein kinase n=1 Tax=Psophocarpus tetragonolobus TaxID=3891 RepID=A0AAN9XR17_PSOTE
MDILPLLIFVAFILIPSLKVSIAVDTIALSQSISDGMTLVSQHEKFELGFFSPDENSNKRYLGIWYKNIPQQTVVWVANGAINGSSGMLTVNSTGNLVLKEHDKVVWYTTTSGKKAQNPVAQLLDSGSLVVRDESEVDSEAYLWQSFDYPSDTTLPGMKLGWNLSTGMEWRMTSWKSPNDPSPGDFYWGLLRYNYPEFYMMKGTKKFVRVGPWNGLHFSGIPDQKPNPISSFSYTSNKREMYYNYSLKSEAVISRMVINQTSYMSFRYIWMANEQFWKVYKSLPKDNCDYYAMCGAYGTCMITGAHICQCLQGFSPKSPQAWNTSDWRQGCVRNKPLNCTEKLKDGFVKVEEKQEGHKKEVMTIVTVTIAIILGMLLIGCYRIYTTLRRRTESSDIIHDQNKGGGSEDDHDLPLLDLSTIVTATDSFSIENKIGEGGFGPVYKGKLESGQEIAVKRLSRSSGQGIKEFKNEVKLIAKLQHRNLVKLLGCCVQEQDKMLVYEYMTNRSLDRLIFDDTKSKLLDWPKRFNIICGIARGFVYLHQDSRLRIIHRDLKASNVLLDDELNPKISDFGIARIFGRDQIEGNTKRVVGTYGYMAPEYAADGLFSMKSDVFSFGVLLLEIISGKRNRGFYLENRSLNLVTHTWSLWKEGRALEIIDSNIKDSCVQSEVLRCIHISLLCVQQHAEDRPVMPSVVLMLGSESELAQPKEPGFYVKGDPGSTISILSRNYIISTNEITITLLEAR